MLKKWLHQGSRRQQKEVASANGNGEHGPSNPAGELAASIQSNGNSKGHANAMPASRPQGDLLTLEDIYRAAGINNQRLGYSINNVIDMLNSEHMKGLSNDIKRASVLMALEASGIPVDDVLQDAERRHESIDTYEASQQVLIDEYEARKTRENAQIQEEIERITSQLVERIKQNSDEVALVKNQFRDWQMNKQKELQRISDATGLCRKQPAVQPPLAPVESIVAVQAVGFVAKP